jgi:hypothetical protein
LILLNYLPVLLIALLSGIVFTMFLKILCEHKNILTSLKLTYLAGKIIVTFPFFIIKASKKNRTELLRIVNKDKSLNEEQRKKLKKIISSDFLLSFFIFRISFLLVSDIFYAFLVSSRKYLDQDGISSKIINKKTTKVLKMGVYKYVEPILVDKFA